MEKKKTYSPSRLNNYVKCPKSFYLSRKHQARIGTTTQSAMRDGNLFEGFVFGFKDNQDEKELIGRKKPKSIDIIKGHAKQIESVFMTKEIYTPGESPYGSYYKLSHDIDGYTMRGEADYIGIINKDAFNDVFGFRPDFGTCIVDLKYTGNIPRVWNEKTTKEDYLQAYFYPYLWYLKTGMILPFVYVIVENEYADAVKRTIVIKPTKEDFEFLQGFIDTVNSDMFFEPNCSDDTCLGGRRGGRCWYIEHCEQGRNLAGGNKFITLQDLMSKQ